MFRYLNKSKYDSNKGDTIIEVLFAISIFSLVVIGGLSIMNKGTAISQRAIETTMVSHQIDAQVEALRFLNSSYIASYNTRNIYPTNSPAKKWYDFSSGLPIPPSSSPSNFGVCPDYTNIGNNKYAIDTENANIVPLEASNFFFPETYAKVDNPSVTPSQFKSYGIWFEAFKHSDGVDNQRKIGYIDFYIYACWDSTNQNVHSTDATIVRLYEPR